MELNYKAIGKRIKIARIHNDITQEKLAEIVNLSPSHMSNIETGTTKVSLTTIVNIANALSVTVDDLLCDDIIKAKPQFENDIKILLDGCDDFEIRIVKELLTSIISTLRRDSLLRKYSQHIITNKEK
ncbi:helix-turn-helix domain-containing protein [Lacrimispora sp.]|uniref:helix-turn-helix domain-containing protein n=1 Tax=Lacrimispora sp. TaxID=2719234 RepID=UPI00345F3095